MRGFPAPELSFRLLRSACAVALALDDEDIAATWTLLRSGMCSAGIPPGLHILVDVNDSGALGDLPTTRRVGRMHSLRQLAKTCVTEIISA
jgi:hypothetical protein